MTQLEISIVIFLAGNRLIICLSQSILSLSFTMKIFWPSCCSRYFVCICQLRKIYHQYHTFLHGCNYLVLLSTFELYNMIYFPISIHIHIVIKFKILFIGDIERHTTFHFLLLVSCAKFLKRQIYILCTTTHVATACNSKHRFHSRD